MVFALAFQRRGDERSRARWVSALQDRGTQHRMRSNFNERVDPAVPKLTNRISKSHRLTDVVPPVRGAERLSVHRLPCDGGDHVAAKRSRIHPGRASEE